MTSQPRVCAVSYLNTVPLVWGMLHGPQRELFDLSFCLPSECAARLESGAADIGIVPSIEAARQGLAIIPGAGIACHGPVRSILLVTKVPPARIRTLALDASSRSSAMLARVILSRRYGVEPQAVSMPPDLPSMLEAADAALVIGDPALRLEPVRLGLAALDLGGEWCEMTGLPMVFAVWAARPEALTSGLAEAFLGSCRFGREHIEDIVRLEAAPRHLTEALARDYFARHIVLELGERDYEGMRLFVQYAREFDTVVSTGGVTA
ncbi:MAG TPA: menaquinone biosynthesis protein [Bryobacteraceae bacterium]|nr:menaquinone biosynthesis protein [Bryobacteraceae bacterium]